MNKRIKDQFYINNPEYSALMQIIEDTNSNGQRRSQIFDRDVKYVSIYVKYRVIYFVFM
jgi:hypothetical protein